MAAAIGVRGDYDAVRLRELAKRSDDANQTRRLLALAAIYDGGSRTEAAKIGGVRARKGRGSAVALPAQGPLRRGLGQATRKAPLCLPRHRPRPLVDRPDRPSL